MCLSSPFLFSSPSPFVSLLYFFAYYFISSHFLSSLHSLYFSFFFSFLPSILYAALLFLFSFFLSFSFSLCLSSPLFFSSHYINHTPAPSIVLRNPEPEHTSATPLSRRLFPVLKQCPFHGNWRRKEQENIPGLLNFSLPSAGQKRQVDKPEGLNSRRWDSLIKSFPLAMYFSCSSCKHACTCLNTQTHTCIKGPVLLSGSFVDQRRQVLWAHSHTLNNTLCFTSISC